MSKLFRLSSESDVYYWVVAEHEAFALGKLRELLGEYLWVEEGEELQVVHEYLPDEVVQFDSDDGQGSLEYLVSDLISEFGPNHYACSEY